MLFINLFKFLNKVPIWPIFNNLLLEHKSERLYFRATVANRKYIDIDLDKNSIKLLSSGADGGKQVPLREVQTLLIRIIELVNKRLYR